MARINLMGGTITDVLLKGGNRLGVQLLSVTAGSTTAIPADGPHVLVVTPAGAATLALWATPQQGDFLILVNAAAGASVLTVTDSAAGALVPPCTPTQNETAILIYTGASWRSFVGLGA